MFLYIWLICAFDDVHSDAVWALMIRDVTCMLNNSHG
uniref:Uncharacterized protein n=1 Tax=Anguilla anguilla TaxID=7936 RepID=A0A0E9WHX3_ANGAN